MRDRLEQRLTDLQSELAAGQKMAGELDAKRAELQATMLRISGAIQVLEEMLQSAPAQEPALEVPVTPSATPAARPARPSNGVEAAAG
jgi:uncharacterized coiled-coil protein SlyX